MFFSWHINLSGYKLCWFTGPGALKVYITCYRNDTSRGARLIDNSDISAQQLLFFRLLYLRGTTRYELW